MNATVLERRHLWLLLFDAALWAGWATLVGYVAHRLPVERLSRDGWLFRLRRTPEHTARTYQRVLRIKRWKPWLPEAGDFFAGGFSKRRLAHRDGAYLERFVVETRRAELTHWGILLIAPVFLFWSPGWLVLLMVGVAVVANVPCLLTQRYNRARLLRALRRLAVGSARA